MKKKWGKNNSNSTRLISQDRDINAMEADLTETLKPTVTLYKANLLDKYKTID